MKDTAETGQTAAAAAPAKDSVPEDSALEESAAADYRLDDQVGFLLRRAQQRHLSIFARGMPELTPTQFAAMARTFELGPASQAKLGRATAMDAATIKGVIDRLEVRGLVATAPCDEDRRRVLVRLTPRGAGLFAGLAARAQAITAETLSPLAPGECANLLRLLRKLG